MAEKIVTPIGELMWIFITGKGKQDLNGNDRFTASVRYKNGSAELKAITDQIETFWKDNRPKGKVRAKSNGIREELDKEGNPTGFHLVNFWTGTTYPDGTDKAIKTYNAKGTEVALAGRKIGNGSKGAVSGAMDTYQNGPNVGVTLYLNAIQLTKFVEYDGDAGFSAVEGDGWTGEDLNEDGFEPAEDTPSRVNL